MFKLFFTPLVLISIIVGCGQTKQSEYKEEIVEVADTKAQITIEGMSCQVGCATYIGEELEKMDGVVSADVDFETKLASVAYDNSLISEYGIINSINCFKDSAYSVSSVEVEIIQTIKKNKIDTH